MQKMHTPVLGFAIGRIIVFIVMIFFMIIGGIFTKGDKDLSGSLAAYVMVGAFIFIPKNNLVNLLIGLPFERALQWHKFLGLFSVFMGIYHGLTVGKIKADSVHLTGLILTIAMGVLVVMSFFKFRRAFYTYFYRIHMIMIGIVLVMAALHGDGGVFIGVVLWAFDLLVRLYMKKKHKKANRTMKFE